MKHYIEYLLSCISYLIFINFNSFLSTIKKQEVFNWLSVFAFRYFKASLHRYSSANWKLTWRKHNLLSSCLHFIRVMYCNKKLWIQVSMDDAIAKMVNSGHFTLANLRESRLYHLSPFTHRECTSATGMDCWLSLSYSLMYRCTTWLYLLGLSKLESFYVMMWAQKCSQTILVLLHFLRGLVTWLARGLSLLIFVIYKLQGSVVCLSRIHDLYWLH